MIYYNNKFYKETQFYDCYNNTFYDRKERGLILFTPLEVTYVHPTENDEFVIVEPNFFPKTTFKGMYKVGDSSNKDVVAVCTYDRCNALINLYNEYKTKNYTHLFINEQTESAITVYYIWVSENQSLADRYEEVSDKARQDLEQAGYIYIGCLEFKSVYRSYPAELLNLLKTSNKIKITLDYDFYKMVAPKLPAIEDVRVQKGLLTLVNDSSKYNLVVKLFSNYNMLPYMMRLDDIIQTRHTPKQRPLRFLYNVCESFKKIYYTILHFPVYGYEYNIAINFIDDFANCPEIQQNFIRKYELATNANN